MYYECDNNKCIYQCFQISCCIYQTIKTAFVTSKFVYSNRSHITKNPEKNRN